MNNWKSLSLIIIIALLAGCQEDNRKCLKSHIETSCQCVCSNNVGIPVSSSYEQCDLYEESNTDE
jgi:hypothetical protein